VGDTRPDRLAARAASPAETAAALTESPRKSREGQATAPGADLSSEN
jgi:hypothetical protein